MTARDSIPEPPLSASERIDEICLRYEDCWMQGAQPRLESFIEEVEPDGRPALVYELLRIDMAYGAPKRELLSESAYLQRLPAFRDIIHIAFRKQHPPAALRPMREGQQVGRFAIERELGRGGFGAVYLARDPALGRQVAVKTLRPDIAADSQTQTRLLDEAKLAAELEHEGIASIYGVEQDEDGRPLLVYQFVDGESLRDRLRRDEMSPVEIAELVADIAAALHHAHAHGVVHCDLQPNNILLDGHDKPVITDFGLAAHDWIRPAEPGEVAGSPPYLAPEQTRGDARQLDARTDIWALGVILYEGLTGRRPFVGDGVEEIIDAIQTYFPPSPRQLNGAIPAALAAICMKCLEKSPRDRFQTAYDLQIALKAHLNPADSRRRFVALGALILLLLTPATAIMLSANAASKTQVKWEAESQLLVQRDGFWSEVGSSATPAVGDGDRVRFQFQLDRPAYVYIVWIDGSGAATPVYPWNAGGWAADGEHRPTHEIALPEQVGEFWEMKVARPATESVVVLARETPLSRGALSPAWFEGLPTQPPIGEVSVVRFQNGLMKFKPDGERSPVFKSPGQSTHGVLVAQRMLMERLRPHFPLIHTYSFSVFP